MLMEHSTLWRSVYDDTEQKHLTQTLTLAIGHVGYGPNHISRLLVCSLIEKIDLERHEEQKEKLRGVSVTSVRWS